MRTFEKVFSDSLRALCVGLNSEENVDEAVVSLGLKRAPLVLFVFGGADTLDPSGEAQLTRLFSESILPAIAVHGGILLDGGTDSGVMRLLGRARARVKSPPPLVGIAVESLVVTEEDSPELVPLEPNHTHFILVPGSAWGDERGIIEAALGSLGNRVIGLMAGGGVGAHEELNVCRRRGWPVILVRGSGGAADRAAEETEFFGSMSLRQTLRGLLRA